jgi:hypothetical protein
LRGGLDLSAERPLLKKSKVLIEAMRHETQSKLTAADHKVYQLLLTRAREQGTDRREYEAELGEMASFLGETHLGRVRASLERLASTSVSYDYVDGREVRRWGTLKLIGYEGVEDLRAGMSRLTYWFDPPVHRELLEPKSFAHLDLYDVSRLTCRYAPRLYELLALPAGYDEGFRKPVRFEPEDLAARLGYVPAKFNAAIFRRDVLDPAMADIAENCSRFRAGYELERAGRGRGGGKVVGVVFTVTPSSKRTEGMRSARLAEEVYQEAKSAAKRGDMPSTLAIGRAVTAHGETDKTLWQGWQKALDAARADPGIDLGGMEGAVLLFELAQRGADAAFYLWADATFGKRHASSPPAEVAVEAPTEEEPSAAPFGQRPIPRREDFETLDDFVRAADIYLGKKPDTRTPREFSEDQLRENAARVIDTFDGFRGGTNRTIKMDGSTPDRTLHSGLALNFCDDFFWNHMDESFASGELRKAWRTLQPALKCLRLMPRSEAEVRQDRIVEIAKAIAAWDWDAVTGIANRIIAKAGGLPSATRRPPLPVPSRRWEPITEKHLDEGYADPAYAELG